MKRKRNGRRAAGLEGEEGESHTKRPSVSFEEPPTTSMHTKATKRGKLATLYSEVEPDSKYPHADEYAVHRIGIIVFSVILVYTDIAFGVKGSNKFYVLQMLKHKRLERYHVFTRWGRVGTEGAFLISEHTSEDRAEKAFSEKFLRKTGNKWNERHKFKHIQGKYTMADLDNSKEEFEDEIEKYHKQHLLVQKTTFSGLTLRHERLLNMIFDVKIARTALYEYKIDAKRFPLGQLTKEALKAGFDTMDMIEAEVNSERPSQERIVALSNRFYTVVPHDSGYARLEALDTMDKIMTKYELLEALRDVEICIEIIRKEKNAVNPLRAKYRQLNNTIELVKRSSKEYEQIRTYFENTKGRTPIELVDVLKTARSGENERFAKYASHNNRAILWHGSRTHFYPAILSNGLRIMPHAGGKLGKGIYFSDSVHTSQIYCGVAAEGELGVLLLCEVALGRPFETTTLAKDLVSPPYYYDSVVGMGNEVPDPDYDGEIDGARIPQGDIVKRNIKTEYLNNEYVVYSEDQIAMRYIVIGRW